MKGKQWNPARVVQKASEDFREEEAVGSFDPETLERRGRKTPPSSGIHPGAMQEAEQLLKPVSDDTQIYPNANPELRSAFAATVSIFGSGSMFRPLIYVCAFLSIPRLKRRQCVQVMEFSKYGTVTIFVPKREFGILTNITAFIFKTHFLSSFTNKSPDLPCH